MNPRNAYAAYKSVEVKTASPAHLVVLLYEGALKHIRKGEALLREEGSYYEAAESLLQAIGVVAELTGALNPQASPKLAQNLSGIYQYVLGVIGKALRERDPSGLAEAADIMDTLGSAWREIEQSAP